MEKRSTEGDRAGGDGVIPTMRAAVAHLRMCVDQTHANFRDNLDWIYADKLERETDALERYCGQLSGDLTDVLARIDKLPEIDAAIKGLRYVRDVLAGGPRTIPPDTRPAKTRRALAREYFGYGCEYESSGDIASGCDLAEPGAYEAAVERGFAKLWRDGQ